MKLKAIEMIEKGEDKKHVEKKLYREFKILVADTILSDRWTRREKLTKSSPQMATRRQCSTLGGQNSTRSCCRCSNSWKRREC